MARNPWGTLHPGCPADAWEPKRFPQALRKRPLGSAGFAGPERGPL